MASWGLGDAGKPGFLTAGRAALPPQGHLWAQSPIPNKDSEPYQFNQATSLSICNGNHRCVLERGHWPEGICLGLRTVFPNPGPTTH